MQTTQQDRRDQFAMAALKGTLSSPEYPNWDDYKTISKDCFNIADAMIAASATPAPSGKLEEAVSKAIEAIQKALNAYEGTQFVAGLLSDALELLESATGNEASESALPEKSEVKELPEKWCIERTPENAEMVNAWLNEMKGRVAHSHYRYFVHHPAFAKYGKCVKQEPLPGYTLIDDATFKAQVLNQQ